MEIRSLVDVAFPWTEITINYHSEYSDNSSMMLKEPLRSVKEFFFFWREVGFDLQI